MNCAISREEGKTKMSNPDVNAPRDMVPIIPDTRRRQIAAFLGATIAAAGVALEIAEQALPVLFKAHPEWAWIPDAVLFVGLGIMAVRRLMELGWQSTRGANYTSSAGTPIPTQATKELAESAEKREV